MIQMLGIGWRGVHRRGRNKLYNIRDLLIVELRSFEEFAEFGVIGIDKSTRGRIFL